jgi:serine/threonine protein kinase
MYFRDKYNIIKEIGRGTYGEVFLVKNSKNDKFAVKIVDSNKIPLQEIDILSSFQHPNILKAIEIFYEDKIYIVLELAQYNLQNYLPRISITDDDTEKIKIIYQIADALNCLHSKYYHCDLKLDNILIKNENAILSDFSLAYSKDIPNNSSPCLNRFYRPPESLGKDFLEIYFPDELKPFINFLPLSNFNDMWAFGIVSFIILTGRKPYNSNEELIEFLENPSASFKLLNSKYIDFFKKVLNPNRHERYQSMNDILTDNIFVIYRPEICKFIDVLKRKNPRESEMFYLCSQMMMNIAIYKNVRIQTFIFAVDLISRLLPKLTFDNIKIYSVVFMYIAIKMFENVSNWINKKDIYKYFYSEDLNEDIFVNIEKKILNVSYGFINVKTLYNYANNLHDLKEITSIILKSDDDWNYSVRYEELKDKFILSEEDKVNLNMYTVDKL